MRFILAALLVVMAGCTTPQSMTDEPPASSNAVASSSSTPSIDLPLPMRPIMVPPASWLRWEGCTGLTFNVELPYESARAAVPQAFLPQGLTPETATLNVDAVSCREASNAARTFGAARYVQATLGVVPLNETWSDGSAVHGFLVSAFVDVPDLAKAFEASSVPVDPAQIRNADAAPQGAAVSWSIERDAERWSFEVEKPLGPNPEVGARLEAWFGPGPFQRLDVDQRYRYHDGLDAGVLVLEGDGPLRRLVGADRVPWTGQAYEALARSIQLANQTFGGNPQ